MDVQFKSLELAIVLFFLHETPGQPKPLEAVCATNYVLYFLFDLVLCDFNIMTDRLMHLSRQVRGPKSDHLEMGLLHIILHLYRWLSLEDVAPLPE